MLVMYVLLVLHAATAHNHHHHRKEKIYYAKADAWFHFQWFMETHNKAYHESEEASRFKIFQENLVKINEMNRRDPHCAFAINQFTDLSTEEFLLKHTGLSHNLGDSTSPCRILNDSALNFGDAPEAFDWRDHIHIQIKNQFNCSCCWAFSATGNVEAQYAIRYKRSISLSEQQLVDCDSVDNGCRGGNPAQAFRYLIQSGGQEPEDVYPYVDKRQMCQFTPGQAQVRLSDCISFQLSDEAMIKEVLYKYGPLTAGIDGEGIHPYHGGVFSNCTFQQLNHAVMIVGYGRDDEENKDFWVIKNSWGSAWGENGFARIERGINSCGILNRFIGTSVIV